MAVKGFKTATQVVEGYKDHDYVEPNQIDSHKDYKDALKAYEARDDVENLAVRRERAISSEFNEGNPHPGTPLTLAEVGQGPNTDGTVDTDGNPATGDTNADGDEGA